MNFRVRYFHLHGDVTLFVHLFCTPRPPPLLYPAPVGVNADVWGVRVARSAGPRRRAWEEAAVRRVEKVPKTAARSTAGATSTRTTALSHTQSKSLFLFSVVPFLLLHPRLLGRFFFAVSAVA